jgi:hypothetical protein
VPVLVVAARVRDEARARQAMARLQPALIRALAPASTPAGALPTFTQHEVGGMTAYQLRAGPSFQLDYAVDKGRVVLATDLSALAALAAGKSTVADQPGFKATLAASSKAATSVVFSDLSQLLDLAEATGLRNDPHYLPVRSDLRRVRALGIQTASGEAESTAEISLQIR